MKSHTPCPQLVEQDSKQVHKALNTTTTTTTDNNNNDNNSRFFYMNAHKCNFKRSNRRRV